MEYILQLGSHPFLSLAEILNVLESESILYKVLSTDLTALHIEIKYINPEVFIQILGGTRAIEDISTGEIFTPNIKQYKKREFKKPRVDPKSGLLPSKLAKMLINLSYTKHGVKRLYDPFCGGGTIITEANVLGIHGIGSDVDKKTVDDAKTNAKWVRSEYGLSHIEDEFFISDVRYLDTQLLRSKHIDAIVTEPYLGKPVHKPLRMGSQDNQNLKKVNELISSAIKNASAILEPGRRIVIIIPQFKTMKGIAKLEISERFNRFSFKRVNLLDTLDIDKSPDLLYFRPKAVVLRDIFILEKL